MKISYRTHPILKGIENNTFNCTPNGMPFYESDKKLFNGDHPIRDLFLIWGKHYLPQFKKDIVYVTEPYYNAHLKAQTKLLDLYVDILKNDISDLEISGTIFIGDKVYMIDEHFSEGSDDSEVSFYVFNKLGMPIMFYLDSVKNNINSTAWVSQEIIKGKKISSEEEFMSIIHTEMIHAISIMMFKQFAEVETKYLPPNKITKDVNCKYVNNTDSPITVLTSKWFTSLVKSDSFKVNGHFRLQPFGKGMKDYKLIWINNFMKSGYTAPAQKLKENA
tara:strand:+ start:73 stop:900 length:828 start_codon:yes stop_codon:yes gene_type:complete